MSAGPDDRGALEVTEAVLHAYVDGQLDAGSRPAVESWLSHHPDKAAEIGHWERQNAALKTMFGPVAAEPVPPRLSPYRLAAAAVASRWDWTRIAAAAVLLVGISAGLGWVLRGALTGSEPPSELLIDGAVTAHALYVKESRHAVEVPAGDKAHLVTWLSNRLGRAIDTPDLASQGFTLVGGRLLPPLADTGTGPAAQLMYQNQTANRLTVYITAALPGRGKSFETETERGLQAYYWANDQITCTVVGDLPQPEMQTLAKGVYQQLTWRPDPAGRW
jgi:anti-sigma factor RsiW